MEINEEVLRRIVREETKLAFKDIGLHDDEAGEDMRDLRSLISDWREIKKTILRTAAKAATLFVLGIMSIGAWNKLTGGGE